MDPEVAREIEHAVTAALAAHAVAGKVVVLDERIELRGGGAPVSIELGKLRDQWPLFPSDLRDRRATELARRLAAAARGGGALAFVSKRQRVIAVPLGALALLALGAALSLRILLPPASVDAANAASDAPSAAGARESSGSALVCEAARKRLYAGASIGPFETDGWVAELFLATSAEGSELTSHPDLLAMIDSDRLATKVDATLAALEGGAVTLEPGLDEAAVARSPGWRAVTVRFSGGYAAAFLDPTLRPRLLQVSERMAEVVSAELAAFYGRCAHLRLHDIGALFRGSDAESAGAALLYGVGMFAESPVVSTSLLADGRAGELDGLRAAAGREKLDVKSLTALVAAEGGQTTTAPNGAVTITFPLGGATRATRASRSLAARVKLGPP